MHHIQTWNVTFYIEFIITDFCAPTLNAIYLICHKNVYVKNYYYLYMIYKKIAKLFKFKHISQAVLCNNIHLNDM